MEKIKIEEEKYLKFKPNIQYINREDELGRYMGFNAYLGIKKGQLTSHSSSYILVRKQYEQLGYTMGFDKLEDKIK